MDWVDSLGGGEGIGAILVALVAVGGLFPRLRKSEKAASRAAESAAQIAQEVSPESGDSMREAIMRMEIKQSAISDSINALRIEANLTHSALQARIHNLEEKINRPR